MTSGWIHEAELLALLKSPTEMTAGHNHHLSNFIIFQIAALDEHSLRNAGLNKRKDTFQAIWETFLLLLFFHTYICWYYW